MSHIVTVQTRIQDPIALATACKRLGLPEPAQGTARLFSGAATGLLVELPGWRYPAVIDTATGTVQFDIYSGAWGEQKELERLLQRYAVEKCRIEAKKKGYQVSEQALQDGSIQLKIVESAG